MLENFFQELYIYITRDCNLNCSYCDQEHTKNYGISEEVLDDFFEKIFLYTNKKFIRLHLYGGEPLLHKKQVLYIFEKISQYVKKNKLIYQIDISTNGLLLDKKFIDKLINILKDNIYLYSNIQISIDGDYNAYNLNRKLSRTEFKKFIDNIQYAINSEKNVNNLLVSASVVVPITNFNINFTKSIFYIFGLGFRKISFTLEQDLSGSINYEKNYNVEKSIYVNTLNNILILKKVLLSNINKYIEISLVGHEPILTIEPNGDMYSILFDFKPLENVKQEFYIGNLNLINSYNDIFNYYVKKYVGNNFWDDFYKKNVYLKVFNSRPYLYENFYELYKLTKYKRNFFEEYVIKTFPDINIDDLNYKKDLDFK